MSEDLPLFGVINEWQESSSVNENRTRFVRPIAVHGSGSRAVTALFLAIGGYTAYDAVQSGFIGTLWESPFNADGAINPEHAGIDAAIVLGALYLVYNAVRAARIVVTAVSPTGRWQKT